MEENKEEEIKIEKEKKKKKVNILIATTGSVASIKIPLIIKALSCSKYEEKCEIQLVTTNNSLHFFDPSQLSIQKSNNNHNNNNKDDDDESCFIPIKVWNDSDEWKSWNQISDPIVHIELRRWADVILICPCSANTLAKISQGICDNLLTSLIRATNGKETPVLVFPSMNTYMYQHIITKSQLNILKNLFNFHIFGPISKTLACGDTGMGAMMEWTDIVDLVVTRFLTN